MPSDLEEKILKRVEALEARVKVLEGEEAAWAEEEDPLDSFLIPPPKPKKK